MLVQPNYHYDMLHMADQNGEIHVQPGSASERMVMACWGERLVDVLHHPRFGPGKRYVLTAKGLEQRNATSYCLAKKIG